MGSRGSRGQGYSTSRSTTTTRGTTGMTGRFRTRLRAGETLLGTMVTLPTPAVAEILAGIGFDWLFIDGEHGPLETADILAILQAVGSRASCVVRVPATEEAAIQRGLDLAAEGNIVP